jgi:hypothetical protein
VLRTLWDGDIRAPANGDDSAKVNWCMRVTFLTLLPSRV